MPEESVPEESVPEENVPEQKQGNSGTTMPRAVISRVARWTLALVALLLFVIIPWVIWGEALGDWALAFSRQDSAFWPQVLGFAGLLAADIVLPVPSSFVAVAAGIALGKWVGALVVTGGLSLGCVIGYGLGLRVGRPGALRLVGPEEFARVDVFAQRFGDVIVLLLRSVPVLAEASVLFAGATRVPFARFMLWSTLANAIIAGVYATAGELSARSGNYEWAILTACALPFLGMVIARWYGSRPRRDSGS